MSLYFFRYTNIQLWKIFFILLQKLQGLFPLYLFISIYVFYFVYILSNKKEGKNIGYISHESYSSTEMDIISGKGKGVSPSIDQVSIYAKLEQFSVLSIFGRKKFNLLTSVQQ